ncbi:hypothetical protein PRIPAC_70121 [Pristionchus pacificus]|uniref:Zinc finger protein n=1 Tax=Pristionchus pacificus TaxID=54126 RepID=A0A2A6BGF9_PRIPA|nr:hypothetical protein PRIPAC_70121 [Pristionchus pacificus]|eukprot:PDM65005.1 zinc finger protein [Pristionchus pacificus]
MSIDQLKGAFEDNLFSVMLKISSVSERLDQWRREVNDTEHAIVPLPGLREIKRLRGVTKILFLQNFTLQAYDYSSSSDRLGIVISRALELLLVVVKHGAGAENLKYAVDSLKWERSSAMHPEKDGLMQVESDVGTYGSADLLPPMAASTMTASAGGVPVDEEKPPAGIGMPTTTSISMSGAASLEAITGYVGNEADMKMEDVKVKDEDDHGFGMPYVNPGSWEQEGMAEFAQSEAGQSDEYPPSADDEPSTSSSRQKAQPGDKSMCELCGASFVRARDLRRHMKTIDHSVYRPRKFTKDRIQKYKCDQCPAQYTRVDNLTRHKALHAGKTRNIKCPHCELMLVDNLNGHLREAHGIDPYPCQKCGQAFSRLELLKTHWTDCYERGDQFKNKSYD